jgi:hypothetical protein
VQVSTDDEAKDGVNPYTVSNIVDLRPVFFPYTGNKAAKIKKAELDCAALDDRISDGMDGALKSFNKLMIIPLNAAERRAVAALSARPSPLEFTAMLESAEALPPNRAAAAAGAGAGAGAVVLDAAALAKAAGTNPWGGAHLQVKREAKLTGQYKYYLEYSVTVGHTAFITAKDTVDAAAWAVYWKRTAHLWWELTAAMLDWLSTATSTSHEERGFSFQTEVDQATKRRNRGPKHVIADIECKLYAAEIKKLLTEKAAAQAVPL